MTDPTDLPEQHRGLRGLDLLPGYDSSDRILETFYVPALSRATSYDRSVGYFRSSALSVAARGLSRFINTGGSVRLLCGAEISAADREALLGRKTLDGAFADRLAERLVTDDEIDRRRLEVLAWLAQEGRLEVRIAIAVDANGDPITGGDHDPYFHEKIGVLRDSYGDGVAFQGSVNESATAWTHNFESFSVYASWDATSTHYAFWANKFDEHWAGRMARFRVYELPDAARQRLLALAPEREPDERDPEEPPPVGDDAVVAHYLRAAPRLIGSEALAEATVGVTLFPHQRQVVARLADLYPRSWLVADEVGLGKTISAGMALRRLLLDGRVRRALILAPANVCRQWQDELFEKFGLWVPRLDGGRVYEAEPGRDHPAGDNPFAEHPVLIASSHLARRVEQQRLVLDAAPYDLVIVDEAHHARRTHLGEDAYRPGRLLELLDSIRDRGAAKALWLLTATPMQLAPIELRDLLVHVGLNGTLADPAAFARYFREVAKDDDAQTAWEWLDRALRETPRMPATPADDATLSRVRSRVGPVPTALIERFGTGTASARDIVGQQPVGGTAVLRDWLRTLSPVGQFVTRHSRATLKLYRGRGLLTETLADRVVEPRIIPFDDDEQDLYDRLDELIDRLMDAHGSHQGAGFILTVYRRRLTSSWAAIRKTLTRRINDEELLLDEDEEEDAGDAGVPTSAAGGVNQTQALPLTLDELREIRGYIDRMSRVTDSKFNRLRNDIDAARSVNESLIVFTQYTDTLDDLRDKLAGAYRFQMATFTGKGGRIFREPDGWVEISKRELIEAVRARRVTLLLATDAASEGLNLQTCSHLINYDMPWNPMRAEQRIGRIDRLGQASPEVHVRNYFIPNTVEESVYRALANRIDVFSGTLGSLQPILGAAEQTFRRIFRAPRSERAAAEQRAVDDLLEHVDDAERGGVEFNPEDPFPLPDYPPPPVTRDDLREVIIDRFAATLDDPERPVTFDPRRASRDPETFTALATYGHPKLAVLLDRRAGDAFPDSSALVLSDPADGMRRAAVRADRTPPMLIRWLADVDELGLPAARGEAEALASQLAREAEHRRRSYEAELAALQRRQSADSLRERFVALVHGTLAAGCAAARYDGGGGADPITVWHSLGDTPGPWGYAEAMRQRLDVPLAQLIPVDLAYSLEPIAVDVWADERHRAGLALQQLMREYQSPRG